MKFEFLFHSCQASRGFASTEQHPASLAMLELILVVIIVLTSYFFAKQYEFFNKLNEVIEILQAFMNKLNEVQVVKKQLFDEDTQVFIFDKKNIFHFEHCRYLEGKGNYRTFTCCQECHKHKK